MSLLEVKRLNTEFKIGVGTVQAVRDVSFSLAEGESIGIVGESGSGKSVTMLSVMGLLPAYADISADSILFDGRELTKMSARELRDLHGRDIGMIFQDPMTSLNPLFTVESQLTEPLRIHLKLSRAEARKRALELLRQVEIPNPEARLKQYPHELSGGMRQSVMIAIAIACSPKLVIADEPTTALDVTIQAQILDLLAGLQRRTGTSVIMITHDLGIVSDLCDRVNVMYGSQIMESGTVDDLFYRTSHPYTRGLLRCLPESVQNLEDKRLHPIMGSPVDLMMLPAGCAFSARCDDCMKLCLNRRPELFEVNPGHTSRCWLTALENAAKEVQA